MINQAYIDEHFSDAAKRVLGFAKEEVLRSGQTTVDIEQLLLGLIRARVGVGAQILTTLGIEFEQVRRAVEPLIVQGVTPTPAKNEHTLAANQVLDLAVEEAHRLHHPYVGTEHLLVGLVGESKGTVAQALKSLGVNLEQIRAIIEAIPSTDEHSSPSLTQPSSINQSQVSLPKSISKSSLNFLAAARAVEAEKSGVTPLPASRGRRLKPRVAASLVLLVVVLVIGGIVGKNIIGKGSPVSTNELCDAPTPQQQSSPPTGSASSFTPLPPIVEDPPENFNCAHRAEFQVGNFQIFTDTYIHCPNSPFLQDIGRWDYHTISPVIYPQPNAPQDQLVFTTDPLTYPKSQLQEMHDFAQKIWEAGWIETPHTPPPPGFAWVPGDFQLPHGQGCSVNFDIMNTSSQTIQISQAGVQSSGDPIKNPYHYNLVNLCSLIQNSEVGLAPGQFGCLSATGKSGPGDCPGYAAIIPLSNQKAGTVFSVPLTGFLTDPTISCPELTLKPGEETSIYLFFTSVGQPNNLIYKVVPQLTLDLPGGPQVLSIPQLGTGLAFASLDQYTCYTFQNQTFVVFPTAQPIDLGYECI